MSYLCATCYREMFPPACDDCGHEHEEHKGPLPCGKAIMFEGLPAACPCGGYAPQWGAICEDCRDDLNRPERDEVAQRFADK